MDDGLKIGSLTLESRLFLGTSLYPDLDTLRQCLEQSGTELVTVGIRRVNLADETRFSLLGQLKQLNVNILPNTAGCFTAKEAVLTAELASQALQTKRVKLEVIGDDLTLYPDAVELLEAARELSKKGFEVYPYCPDDVVTCQKLIDLGCVCVMPLAAPIGSGRGLMNPYNLKILRKKILRPIIIDAGIGTASDASQAMELGIDGVLINTAIAQAGQPITMALAMSKAVQAGRLAYLAKRVAVKEYASLSTPDTGRVRYVMKE